ncbi:MAG: hypothetical protein RLZZ383_2885 [Pseudomonadota bacterium]|jgi:hypothetical protein
MRGVTSTLRAVPRLTDAERTAMWDRFSAAYEDVSERRFFEDLEAKQDVILLWRGPRLVGFSTLLPLTVHVDGVAQDGVFSGDTVVEAGSRGSGALGVAFLRYLVARRLRRPWRPLWWFLLSKGWRTYLLLANNFPDAHPRPQVEMPPAVRRLRDAFGARFAEAYDPATGLVRLRAGRVRSELAALPVDAPPLATYFAQVNPEAALGDELVAVAPLPWSLLPRYAWKKLVGSR